MSVLTVQHLKKKYPHPVRAMHWMTGDYCVGGAFCTEVAATLDEDHRAFPGSYELTKLESYRLPIPEFVLAKAIQIKKELPEIEFYVQSLESHPDPFLVASRKYEEHAYIEVWAEPKFEGRISA